jgi:hypothetical protein
MSQKTHSYVESFADIADATTYIESQILNYSNIDWKLNYANIGFYNGKYRVGVQFSYDQGEFDFEAEACND